MSTATFLVLVIEVISSVVVANAAYRKGRSWYAALIVCWIVWLLASAFFTPLMLFVASRDLSARPNQTKGAYLAAGLFSVVASMIIGGAVVGFQRRDEAELQQRAMASGEYRKCPYCAEPIHREAIKCRHCGASLETVTHDAP